MNKKEIAKRNFMSWNKALLSGDPKKVAVFYTILIHI
jgi:hypothetical protein